MKIGNILIIIFSIIMVIFSSLFIIDYINYNINNVYKIIASISGWLLFILIVIKGGGK